MLELYDKNRKKIAILQNAYNMVEELKINSVNYFTFTLPYNDIKNEHCQTFNFVRYRKGQLYRILPVQTTIDETGGITYKCEHVLALLIDNVLFGEHIVGNKGYYTKDVIKYVLSKQITKNWVLGECDFNFEYEYSWSCETLLSAIFSIVNPFTNKYIWTFDTNSYPFKLNLKKIDDSIGQRPQMYIREKKNMLRLNKNLDPSNVCTRLYPLGAGEGINQVNIKNIIGKYYIESPKSYIDKYGIIEKVWIDRQYTDEQSLYDVSLSILNELQEPLEEYQVDFALLATDSYDLPELGKLVDIVGYKKTFITGITYNYDEIETSTISIANKPYDIASTLANIQDRQRIEMTYSQGATQFYQDHVYDNADANNSLQLKLMIPSDMKIINAVKIDVDMSQFRKPFTVTGGGGGQTIAQSSSSSSGASTTTTTSSGGGQTSSSSSMNVTSSEYDKNITTPEGGGKTSGSNTLYTTSYYDMDLTNIQPSEATSQSQTHNHGLGHHQQLITDVYLSNQGEGVYSLEKNSIRWVPSGAHTHGGHSHNMVHTHTVPNHRHSFTIKGHSHGMSHTHNVSSHTHNMQHTHSILHTHSIPDHIHSLNPGISYGGSPTKFDLIINGKKIKTVLDKNLKLDITEYLINKDKKITRDVYHKVEILPNSPAYIMLTVNVQGFIQSRGNNTV